MRQEERIKRATLNFRGKAHVETVHHSVHGSCHHAFTGRMRNADYLRGFLGINSTAVKRPVGGIPVYLFYCVRVFSQAVAPCSSFGHRP